MSSDKFRWRRAMRSPCTRRLAVEPLERRALLATLVDLVNLAPSEGAVLVGDAWQDLAGRSVGGAGDVDGDGYDDLLIGAPATESSATGAGQAYLVQGRAGMMGDVELAMLDGGNGGLPLLGIETGDRAGFAVSGAGDVNGDGYHDFLVSAPWAGRDPQLAAPFGAGQAYVVFGGFSDPPQLASLDGTNGFAVHGVALFDRAGFDVSGVGDVNGDGYDDLLIGAPIDGVQTPSNFDPGEAYFIYGRASGFDAVLNLWELSNLGFGFRLPGIALGDGAGASVGGVGDLNGDGFGDFAIGAPRAAGDAGEVYVVFGGFSTTPSLADLDGANGFRLAGFAAEQKGGFAVSGAGDVNGDGFDDLLVGAPGALGDATNPGRAYVVFGSNEGFGPRLDIADLDGTRGFALVGIQAGDRAGMSVAGAGDVNGDGYDDLLIGAPNFDLTADDVTESSVGEAYVVFGRPSGFPAEWMLADLSHVDGLRLRGEDAHDLAGFAVSGAGDVNGDGFADVLLGAPVDIESSLAAGRGYLVYGRDSGADSLSAGSDGDDRLETDDTVRRLIGGAGDDRLSSFGGADVVLRGGQGDDELEVGDDAFLAVDGGRGFDTLRVLADGLDLDLAAIPDNRLTGIERIDLTGAGANHLAIGSVRDVLSLSDTSNRLIVDRDRSDTIDVPANWTEQSPAVVEGRTYRVFQRGSAELWIADLPPVIDLNGAASTGIDVVASFVEDGPAIKIVADDLVVADEDRLVGALLSITNLRDGALEALQVDVGTTGLAASYDATTGELRISGDASAAVYQRALKTVRYSNAADAPNLEPRRVTVVVNADLLASEVATATIDITAVNDAPRLTDTVAAPLSPIDEDVTASAGDTVATLVSESLIEDADGEPVTAIAVVAAESTNGRWQYSVDGRAWVDLGEPAIAAARLLAAQDRLRFVPLANFVGSARLVFRAWDRSAGDPGEVANTTSAGGTSPFSVDAATATIEVRAVNDAPVIVPDARPTLTPIARDNVNSAGDVVGLVIKPGTIEDVDGPSTRAIAVVGVDDANGAWQYLNAASIWTTIDATESAARLLGPARRLRFVPTVGFAGTAQLTYRAWDQSAGTDLGLADTTLAGGATAFSAATGLVSVTVEAADDPPTLDFLRSPVVFDGSNSRVIDLTGITDGGAGVESLVVVAASSHPEVLLDPVVDYTSPATSGRLTLVAGPSPAGWAIVTVRVTEADGDAMTRSFTVSVGDNPLRWQNPREHRDVDGDGFVTPSDVLRVINELNQRRFSGDNGSLPSPPPPSVPPPFLDVSGDGNVTPQDALLVINLLNRIADSEGEGEFVATNRASAESDGSGSWAVWSLGRSTPAPAESRESLALAWNQPLVPSRSTDIAATRNSRAEVGGWERSRMRATEEPGERIDLLDDELIEELARDTARINL